MLLIVKLLWEKISALLKSLFGTSQPESSVAAKQRLKLVIAHDRAGLSAETIEAMRREILAVVARYVDIDIDESEFSLSSDERMTSLVASLPIRRIRTKPLDATAEIAQAVKVETTDLKDLGDMDISAELITEEPKAPEVIPDVEWEPSTKGEAEVEGELESAAIDEESSTSAEAKAESTEASTEASDTQSSDDVSDS